MERIASDAAAGLYESMHINFAAAAPGRLIEQLASAAVRGGGAGRVAKLFDQYCSFVGLEPSLFSLGLPDAYVALNNPGAKDNDIEVGGRRPQHAGFVLPPWWWWCGVGGRRGWSAPVATCCVWCHPPRCRWLTAGGR